MSPYRYTDVRSHAQTHYARSLVCQDPANCAAPAPAPDPRPLGALSSNGVTVVCPNAKVGDTFVVGGVTYTKRDYAGLVSLVGNAATEAELATSCISGVTWLQDLFYSYSSGTKVADPSTFNPDLSTWDTSAVTGMQWMAKNLPAFNPDISKWDTQNVLSMAVGVYPDRSRPNPVLLDPLSLALSSLVRSPQDAFFNCFAFNQNIGDWNVAKVEFMTQMFEGARSFNQDLSR